MNPSDRESIPVARPLARPVGYVADRDEFFDSLRLAPGKALLEIGLVFFFLFLPYIVVFVQSLFYEGVPEPDMAGLGAMLYLKVLLSGSLLILVVYALVRRDGLGLRSVGVRRTGFWGECSAAFWALILIYVLQGIFMLVLFLGFPRFAEKVAQERMEVAGMFPEISPIWLLLFTLFVGLYEELVFRGFLITRLKALTGSVWFSVILSSILFGMIHFYQDTLAMVQIMIVALVLGGLFVIRKSLLAPILVHMAFDFITLATVFWASKVLPEKFDLPDMILMILS